MTRRRVQLTFPADLVREPIIYQIGRQFEVVFNIRRADVAETFGWVQLELDGTDDEIKRALDWAQQKGVHVDLVEGDIIAG